MRPRTAVYFRRNAIRTAWHIAIPIAIFLAARLTWGWQTNRQYAALEKRYQALGFPLNPTIRPPDPDNPAAFLLRATALSTLSPAESQLLRDGDGPYGSDLQWTDAHKPHLHAILTRLKPAFDEIDTAAKLKPEPLFSDPNMPLSPIRDLANALRADAVLLAQDHQDALALHRINQILTISRIIDGDHTLIGHLVAVGIRAVAAQTLERLQPDLGLSNAGIPEARAAIQTLTDFAPFQQNAIAAMRGEAVWLSHYTDGPEMRSWWIRPFVKSETLLTARINDDTASILLAHDNWPGFQSAFWRKFSPEDPDKQPTLYELPFTFIGDPNPRPTLIHFRTISDSSAAAMLLAAELFKQSRGHYPQSAADMVPDFLPKIPADPFDASGNPMRYRLDPAGPTVWSVGENGTDEHAAIRFSGAEKLRRYGNSPTEQPDIIYGAAWRTAAPPATAPK